MSGGIAAAAGDLARAECDAEGRLLRAGEPLAALQLACGGELPGTIAVPELLALVRSAREHAGALSCTIHAHDGRRAVSAWAQVQPQAGGWLLTLSGWRFSPLPHRGEREECDPHSSAGLLGHDLAESLREPIGRIVARAEAIRSRSAGPLADRYATYAGDIVTAGRHLLALVDDLTDLAAIEGEDFAVAEEQVDLAELARRAAAMLQQRAQARRMVIEAPAAGACWPALGERRRVLQVILNVLGNAVSYAPLGSTVRIAGGQRAGGAWLAVSDGGPGLAPAAQARVFDKFERLGRGGDGGSGLGLYISRRLARAMGGELSVAGGPGEGTCFTLELPGA